MAGQPSTSRLSTDARVEATQAKYTDGVTLRTSMGLKKDGHLIEGSGSFNGEKIVVAVIDSGIELSKDIEPERIVAFFDFTRNGRLEAVPPYDDYGHGTHVAGLIGGDGSLSSDRFRGPAMKVRFVGYKVLDETGAGYTSHVIAALDHAVANRNLLGIRLINLSLGHPVLERAATDPLVRAVDRAVAAGIVVVVSAGNHGTNAATGAIGYGGITVPGNAPSAITVGAIDIKDTVERYDDVIQPYSSRGPTLFDAIAKPDIAAPGHRLVAPAAKASTLYRSHSELRVVAQGKTRRIISG